MARRTAQKPSPNVSPMLSPSILGPAETPEKREDVEVFVLPDAAASSGAPSSSSTSRRQKKRAGAGCSASATHRSAAPVVPDGPCQPSNGLLSAEAGTSMTEEYGTDEKQLNQFLKLHPMLSLESTSARTLQLVQGLLEQAAIAAPAPPLVTKSYDDTMLRPCSVPGERECVCGETCLCTVMAKVRHGADTDLAFVGVEFLLPDERAKFLASGVVPERRKKCLVCTRYYTVRPAHSDSNQTRFDHQRRTSCSDTHTHVSVLHPPPLSRPSQHYTYLLARSDPHFNLANTPLAVQPFTNPGAYQYPGVDADAEQLPATCSPARAVDGYTSDALLFVDEQFANTRAARESRVGALMWKPVVRFNSRHYRYEKVAGEEPRIVQVGIGVSDESNFRPPPSEMDAPTEA